MIRRPWTLSLLLATLSLAASSPGDLASAQRKFAAIDSDRLPYGARVPLTCAELSAWAAHEVPAGVRNPQVRVTARDLATGTAVVDFGKLERSAGHQPGWLVSQLIDGPRPVSVTARIRSASGSATVDIERVEISGFAIDGRTLDFLIRNFLIPLYPDAAISRPFDLGHRIDRLDISPAAIVVRLK